METYIVQNGDSPDSIAQKFGFKEWKLIYEHPDNGALRSTRGANEVKADDRVIIPDLPESNISAGGPANLIATSGKAIVLPPVHYDAHMHIMSGNCTPMPALVQMMADKGLGWAIGTGTSRTKVNRLGWWGAQVPFGLAPTIGDLSHRNTLRIGQEAVRSNNSLVEDTLQVVADGMGGAQTYEIPAPLRAYASTKGHYDARASYLGMSIVLTMDMDYCHLAGYQGEPVYSSQQTEDGPRITYYWRTEPDKVGEKITASSDEADLHETWLQQVRFTEQAAAENPFRLLPLYHFEPRRYIKSADKTMPFKKVVTASQAGAFVGFKMYTPQGYMPQERHAPVKDVLSWFFAECAKKDIPIMTHCTPSGFYTHERRFYLENEPDKAIRENPKYWPPAEKLKAADENIRKAREHLKALEQSWQRHIPLKLRSARGDIEDAIEEKEKLLNPGRMRYFYENYVHPEAWRPVLKANPQLRLCLAHFASDGSFWNWRKGLTVKTDGQKIPYDKSWIGSIVELCKEYENFYTDISYLDLMEDEKWKLLLHILKTSPWMLKKVMFGTDWYMITAEPVEYADWYTRTIRGLEFIQKQLPTQVNLFTQFAMVNPTRFYRLMDVGPKMKEGLKALQGRLKVKGPPAQQLEDNFTTLMRLKQPLEQIDKAGGLASGPLTYTATQKMK
ncbi:amidohydrolase [Myxococcus sp. RHSTA-1-4]|uniref:amidohydrolase n=1 Tax=Myxococcus sp. RHSTA-1-4 TaxID=2874601 RepID=UPI001CC1519B|nr:amidohydrolase [Myxococcus sp. RHSTA-1-4]MBZ4416950.1 amidohydrolase [Myxococcus sp. RHSTA-1-4]